MEEEFDDGYYQLDVGIEDIYLLYHCVQETIKNWPGSPARPAHEQEHLWYLRDSFYRMVLEDRFEKS